jgi:hypothetical protein
MRWSGAGKGPLDRVMRGIQEKKHAQWKQMLERAVMRGELPAGTDVDLVHDVVMGTLMFLVVLAPRRSDEARLRRAIDTILVGVRGASGTHGRRRRAPR